MTPRADSTAGVESIFAPAGDTTPTGGFRSMVRATVAVRCFVAIALGGEVLRALEATGVETSGPGTSTGAGGAAEGEAGSAAAGAGGAGVDGLAGTGCCAAAGDGTVTGAGAAVAVAAAGGGLAVVVDRTGRSESGST